MTNVDTLKMDDIEVYLNSAKWIKIRTEDPDYTSGEEFIEIVLSDIQVEKLKEWLNKVI